MRTQRIITKISKDNYMKVKNTSLVRDAEATLTAAMRDAAAHETEDAKTGKLKLHPYLRNRLTKAEKIAARRNK